MTHDTASTNTSPLGNASTILGQKGKRKAEKASAATGGATDRDQSEVSNGLFVTQNRKVVADSEAGEPGHPIAKRRRMATVHKSIEETAKAQAKRVSTETLKASKARQPSNNGGSVRSTPSSTDDEDDELVELEHLSKTGIKRSRDEFGKAVRGEALGQCRVLEKVFATRSDKGPKKLHLAFRGAIVKLEKSNTLERLRANLKMEVLPFLGDALSVATTECNTYKEFCNKNIHDFLDDRQFKKVILGRSESKLRAVQKAKTFVHDLLEDLEQKSHALLREKIAVPAAASGPREYINLT